MKKVYALLLLALLGVGLYGQKFEVGESTELEFNRPEVTMGKTSAIDTIETYLFRASSAIIYGVNPYGYIFGTSWSGVDTAITAETAMHYDAVAGARVTEVLFWAAYVNIAGSADDLTARVYQAGTDSMPLTQTGFGTVSNSTLTPSTSFVYSSVPINTGTGDTGGNPFLVSLDYEGYTDDTIGIVSSNADSSDGAGERRAKQRLSAGFGGGWSSAAAIWVGGIDADAFIIPVIDDTPLSVDNPVNSKGLSLLGNYPNPATSVSTIKFGLTEAEQVRVTVFDLTGRILFDSGDMELVAGEHEVSFDVSTLAAGNYYYNITTEKTKLTSKLNVVH